MNNNIGDTAPVAAEPVLDQGLYSWLQERGIAPDSHDGQIDMTEVVEALNEHERQLIASTPAAPGIDLEQFRESVIQEAARAVELWMKDEVSNEAYAESKAKRDRLLALIAASPKGGSDAQSWKLLESGEIIARGDQLLESDCTTWSELVGWEVGIAYNPAFYVPMRRLQATSAEVGA